MLDPSSSVQHANDGDDDDDAGDVDDGHAWGWKTKARGHPWKGVLHSPLAVP